jgi:hypothetical protein
MRTEDIDPVELCKRMHLAFGVVMAHRIARGLSLDRDRITRLRDVIESRVIMALEETDASQMPDGWSWQEAAEKIALQVALAIVQEQNNEPPVPMVLIVVSDRSQLAVTRLPGTRLRPGDV